MKHKGIFWGMFAVICILSWVDYQVFTEGSAMSFAPSVRQMGHLSILILLAPIGYIGCLQYGFKVLKYWWLLGYAACISLLIVTGGVQMEWQLFNTPFLDRMSAMRLFFCSPVPYFMLYIINTILDNRMPVNQRL